MPIVSNAHCKSMFLKAGRHEFIPEIFLCAGHERGSVKFLLQRNIVYKINLISANPILAKATQAVHYK